MFIEEWFLQKRIREMIEEAVVIHESPPVEIPYFSISSECFEVETQGMQAYKMPITSILEENALKEIQEEADRRLKMFFDNRASYPKRGGCF